MAIIRCPHCKLDISIKVDRHEKKARSFTVSFDFKGGEFVDIPDDLEKKFRESYKNYDVEKKKMCLWLYTHPDRAKKDYPSFMQRWLDRAKQLGGSPDIIPEKKEPVIRQYLCSRCNSQVVVGQICKCEYGGKDQ